ncbi:glycosyltransferase family 2 protein [Candidatus Saccharibacteria bacterium]|nr:glycosyltransferase family 2 protein [Candidatus Saccharibacteria bacterium]
MINANKIVVSVVVPAYNAEKTLKRCLDSIINQTYNLLDIIVVDDGSSDSTFSLMKKYADCDKRIKVLCGIHKGPNAARAIGVSEAVGEYVMFVDSDDYIASDAVSIIVDNFKRYDVDAVRFNGEHQKNGKIIAPVFNSSGDFVIDHSKIMDLLLTTYKLNSLCLQAYKTKMLQKKGVFESSLCFGEDFLTNLRVHKNTDSMLVINAPLYYYCFNSKSITRTNEYDICLRNISDRILVSNEAIKSVRENDEDFRKKVVYNQVRMIKGSILGVAKVKRCKKARFINDLSRILTKEKLTGIDINELNEYMETLGWLEKIKNRGIINAVVRLDYDAIWRYIKMYRKIVRFHK